MTEVKQALTMAGVDSTCFSGHSFRSGDIKGIIEQAFSLKSKYIFLKSQKNNLLCIAERQELNGAEVIHLAGKGALYLLSAEMESMVSTTKSFPELHSPSVPAVCVFVMYIIIISCFVYFFFLFSASYTAYR